MNKKAFTLVEMLLIVALLALITTIVVPNISYAIKVGKEESYKDYEKLLITSLEMYNIDKKEDLWDGTNTFVIVTKEELKRISPDLDIENIDCKIIGSFTIYNNYPGYDYKVCIKCGENYQSERCD